MSDPISATAQIIADHVLLLLAAGVLLVAIGAWVVVVLAKTAAHHKDRLWIALDLLVPGHLWRPRTYLLGHLALGLVLAVATLAFGELAEEALGSSEIAAFDRAFAAALRAETSPMWRSFFWYVTWLGAGWPVTAIGVAVLWALLHRGHGLFAIMWAVSQAGSGLLNYALKVVFGRPRPEGADPSLFSSGLSFPSGHAMGTIVLCGVGAYLIVRLVPSLRSRVPLIALLLVWPLLVGFSRLYLGVHYASDVIAGYLAGLAWIAACVSGAEVALRRRTPPPSPDLAS